MLYRTQGIDAGLSRAHLEKYLHLSPEGRHAAEAKSLLDEPAQSTAGPILVLGSELERFSPEGAK
jgi:hypothetical protein